MSTPEVSPRQWQVAVGVLAILAFVHYVLDVGALLLAATAALLVALAAGRGGSPTGRTTRRAAAWVAATVVALPLLFGALLALGGALSEESAGKRGGGPDERATTLASGVLADGDLTRRVRAALGAHGHAAGGIDCPTLTGPTTEASYRCTGTVAGWQRVQVNMHEDRRFTVVGVSAGP